LRQKIRLLLVFFSLLLFPVTLNFFSPYISIDGAIAGIVSGSVIVFAFQFVSGVFFGRAWCAWLCPVAGLSEMAQAVNRKTPPVRALTIVRYAIFTVWFGVLVAMFVVAGGIRGVNPLHLTENLVSVDAPLKFITYYLVVFLLFGLSLAVGRRASCHAVCWMSPFLVGGSLSGRLLRLPRLKVKSDAARCAGCKSCDSRCPMSIPVSAYAARGEVSSLDCILCGQCVDGCPNRVLFYSMRR
jgi:polyferredoxin